MPKKIVPALPDDVPNWDALVAELRDPRPYEPLEIPASYVIPDDAFVTTRLGFDAAWSELDRDVDDALSALDDVNLAAVAALDAVYAVPVVDAPTAVVPALTAVDAASTAVLPVWPARGYDDREVTV